ncbi:MAG: hypothetical protein ACJLS2_12080 [Microcella pacifica]
MDWFGTGSLGARCPAGWTGDYQEPPTDGPTVVCLAESVPAGIHLFSSVQFINETFSSDRGDAVYVPATPTVAVDAVPGGAIFSGSVDTLAAELAESGTLLDYVEVLVRDSESTVVCADDVDAATGQWSCTTALATGEETFTAVAQSVGFSDDPGAPGQVVDYWDGISALSAPVAATIPPGVVPPPPTMTYELGAASVGVTAEGLEGSSVGVEVYDVEPDGEGGYSFGFPVASCGDLPEGEGGGEGGGGFEPESAPLSPATVEECVFDELEPGIWNFYAVQSYYFQQSEYQDDYVLIPEVPTFSAAPGSNGRVLASGEGEPGFRVLVRELGGAGACTAIVDTEGAWSCSFAGASGPTLVRAQQQSQGFAADPGLYYEGLGDSFDGFSAYTAAIEVVVAGPAAPPAPIPTPTPAVTPAPFSWTLEGFDGQNLRPGQRLSLSARGLPPGTSVTIQIFSTPRTLGTSVADASGLFALDVVVPEDLEPGEHTLVATATPPGGTPSQISTPVMVDPALDAAGQPLEESVDDGAEENAGSGEGAGGASGSIARDDPAVPSELTEAIPTAAEIFRNPIVTVTAGGLALAILLLVAFPTELLNSTLSANTRRFGRGFAAFERGVDRVTDWFAAVTRTRAAAAAVLIVVTSVIFGFMDPSFGFDAVSLRLTLALAIGLFLVTYISSWISGAIIWRAWRIENEHRAAAGGARLRAHRRRHRAPARVLAGLPHRPRHRPRDRDPRRGTAPRARRAHPARRDGRHLGARVGRLLDPHRRDSRRPRLGDGARARLPRCGDRGGPHGGGGRDPAPRVPRGPRDLPAVQGAVGRRVPRDRHALRTAGSPDRGRDRRDLERGHVVRRAGRLRGRHARAVGGAPLHEPRPALRRRCRAGGH